MQHNSLVKRLSSIEKVSSDGKFYFCRNGIKEMRWANQFGTVVCLRVRKLSEKDDLQSDYTSGSFHDTIKSAILDFVGA